MGKNPHEPTLILASKQALLILVELGKMLGKELPEMQPAIQLMKVISDFEQWNKENPGEPK